MGRMTTHTLWKIENVPNHQPVYIYIYATPLPKPMFCIVFGRLFKAALRSACKSSKQKADVFVSFY